MLSALQTVYMDRGRCLVLSSGDAVRDFKRARAVARCLRDSPEGRSTSLATFTARVCRFTAERLRRSDPESAYAQSAEAVQLFEEAVELFDEAAEALREQYTEGPDDVGALTELAWTYCGKFASLNRLISDQVIPALAAHVEPAVRLLSSLTLTLPAQTQDNLVIARLRAVRLAPDGSVDWERNVRQLAAELIRHVVAADQPVVLQEWLESYDAEPALRAAGPSGADAELPPEDVQFRIARTRPSTGPKMQALVPVLSRAVLSLVRRETDGVDEETLAALIRRDQWTREKKGALEECQRLFEDLFNRWEKGHSAEGAYGLACLFAIHGSVAESVYYFMQAIDISNNYEYMNRACVDEDLDSMRMEPAFQEILASIVPRSRSSGSFVSRKVQG